MLRNDLKYVEAHGQISARLLERTGQLEGLALPQMGPEAAAQAADLNPAVEI